MPRVTGRLSCFVAAVWLGAAAACTPVAAVKREAVSDKPDISDAGMAETSVHTLTADVSDACAEPGERSCSKTDVRLPLLCDGARWQAQEACAEQERCEAEPGAQLGRCVPIATECLNHGPDEDFCDGELIRSCEGLVLRPGRKCEERQRCKEVRGRAQCVCAEGWVDDGSGEGCQVPTSCADDNGGCDMLTTCSQRGGARVCSACPMGYEGTGETGCRPQLSALSVEQGTLSPAFSPEIHSYRVRLPLLQQSVLVTASSAPDVRVRFNDVEQTASASGWQSPPLPLGEHTLEITLSSSVGLDSQYEVVIERTGAQVAYVKAADPDREDEFGTSVAIWGDTMALGAAREDSSSSHGDEVNNSAQHSGAVRVFVRSGGTWTEQAYLKADPLVAGDYFGASVALRGDLLVVGAPGASPIAETTPHGGCVYVFKRTGDTWSRLHKLEAADSGAQALFGQSLALDDRHLVVGAPFESSGTTLSGSIYVFERDGDDFGSPRRVKASPTRSSGLFGWSVALGGEIAVVGAPQYNPLSSSSTSIGMAYAFNTEDWTQVQELAPPASLEIGATFGWTVDIAGDTVAVGAPRARTTNVGQSPGDAFVYERTGSGAWRMMQAFRAPSPRASDWYGYVVKLLSPSSLLVASVGDASGATGLSGDPHDDSVVDSGAIMMYGRDGDEWILTTFIKPSNPDTPDYFGSAFAVHGDTLVSTSPGEASDAPGVNSNQASNAAPGAGAAYVFR